MRRNDFALLPPDSLYIPFHGLAEERKMEPKDWEVYTTYTSQIYRQYRVWVRPFLSLHPELIEGPVYFRWSGYIPHFQQHAYRIECVEGLHLVDYLNGIETNSQVAIAVQDDGSQQITGEIEIQLRELGIQEISRERLRCGYIWVATKLESGYHVEFEACSEEKLYWSGELGKQSAEIASAGAIAGSVSSIRIAGREHSTEGRGFNIVVVHPAGTVEAKQFDTFATVYAQGSLFCAKPVERDGAHNLTLISHAGGRIGGRDYTNCQEAFQHSYEERGHRWFEVDLLLTSDGELVARHDWGALLSAHLEQPSWDTLPSLEEFMSTPILGQYAPMNVEHMMKFLMEHPDAILVTDSKLLDPHQVARQFERLIDAATSFDRSLLLRIAPQIYNPQMLEMIDALFPFPRYIYTLYQTKACDEEVCRTVSEQRIRYVTMDVERFSPAFAKELRSCGAEVWLHTLNDPEQILRYMKWDVTGFYTDTVSRLQLRNLVAALDERSLRASILELYLSIELKLSVTEARLQIEDLDAEQLAALTEKIFRAEGRFAKLAVLADHQSEHFLKEKERKH